MGKKLSDEQIESYHRDGFVFPIDVMSVAQAEQLHDRLVEAEARYPREISATNRNNAHLTFQCVDDIVHHAGILDAVEDLIGPNILAWGSVLFIKNPDAKSFVSWHQDLTYLTLDACDGVTAWLALTPANRHTGCMQMIPGSHRFGIYPHEDEFGADNILTRGQTITTIDESQAVDIILQPGQISLHHGHTVHASAPNHSGQRRVGVALQQYIPTHMRETNARGFAQLARGHDEYGNFELLPRPEGDMPALGQDVRARTNQHWAGMLYSGAEQKRAY